MRRGDRLIELCIIDTLSKTEIIRKAATVVDENPALYLLESSEIGNSNHIELRCMFDNKEGCVRAEHFGKIKSEHLSL